MLVAESKAREAIGTYRYDWTPLAESTQADRVRQGWPADEPLLRTGALAASIQHKVETTPIGAEGLVYSDDIIAFYQEMGTDRGIPPRSFLYKGLIESLGEAGRIYVGFVEKIFL